MKKNKQPLSVYMITFNNGKTIEHALESVADWADEIVVVDSHSTDGSLEIMERYTDHVFQFDNNNFREKYQHAQDRCRNPWVLFIDADEWLTERIKKEIAEVIATETIFDGFVVSRRNIYLGREIKYGGWYPDEEIRLYRKKSGYWKGDLHAKIYIEGKVGRLKNHYMHTPYLSIADQIKTVDRYSATYARDLHSAGRSFHMANLLFRPAYRFFRDYVMKRGFLDGLPGLIIVISTMYYVFMKHAKLWEIERKAGR
ncbi:MAG: glycosyltransferase family 2 protein [Syntrophobacterales bacterium]|jgi:glycosyltransferase involved in cell wall biosynthesis|nr:glycosyltransferase family 2 protein [Syntrophobacterales bacterium]